MFQNKINFKKPAFWVVLAAVAVVVIILMGFLLNPLNSPSDQEKGGEAGLQEVNAIILELDKEAPTMTVQGMTSEKMENNSVIGDQCILTWGEGALITLDENGNSVQLTIEDFAVGDVVVLMIGEVQETYPTQARAVSVQLLPEAETVTARYEIARLRKNEPEQPGVFMTNDQLAKNVIMESIVKSSAWKGVDITTLKECYRIRQSFDETGEVHDYYAYRIPESTEALAAGTAVLQSGENGWYSTISDNLYEDLAKYVIYPDEAEETQRRETQQNRNYSQSLTAEELAETEEVVRSYFTVEAPYYEGVVSLEIMPDDYDLYQNAGIESEYAAGNIIIYKVLTGKDEKEGNPERSATVARASEDAAWEVINHGY